MKKLLLVLISILLIFTLTACGGNDEVVRPTLEDAINAFVAAGIEVDPDEKPFYQELRASDAVMFEIGVHVVRIYEYVDIDTLNQAIVDFEFMQDYPVNGLLVLETTSQQAIEIFESL